MRVLMQRMALAIVAAIVAPAAWAGDEEVAQAVAGRIVDSGKLSDYEVGVKVKGNVAWLSGRVRNQQQMQQAMALAKSTPSIDKVVNRLTIGNSSDVRHAGPQVPNGPVARTSAHQQRGAMQASMGGPMQGGMASPIPAMPGVGGGPLPAGGMNTNLGSPMPMYAPGVGGGAAPVTYDQPALPNYAWPSYAAYPNYAALTYPRQYSPTAWPYIGPFYPYPQVPLGWRKVTLEWDDGWWWLDFKHGHRCD